MRRLKVIDLDWFNLNPSFNGKMFGKNFKWFNAFRRRIEGHGLVYGFGLIQIGGKHLFYVGKNGLFILFIGKMTDRQ